jgi:WD40-like Beta Propeller Repeat
MPVLTSPVASVLRSAVGVFAAVVLTVAVAACGGGKPSPVASSPPSGVSPSAAASAAAGTPPAMVAVTTGGALVTLNSATGVVEQTLVSSGVLGDEVSVGPSGLVYFAVQNGCNSTIEQVPVSGGSAAVIATGSLPAVSPNGTKLAYASQPSLTQGCVPNTTDMTALYQVKIRTLSSGATISLAANPASQDSGLPVPISHLSWAVDNQDLAVSIAQAEDNEGWEVTLVNTAQAQYFRTGAGVVSVPVTGSPTPQQSYLREGVYMPNGDLFVSRACCAGFPPVNSSRLMWEVNTSGALVHQVAIGYPNLDHTSLDVSPDGRWLLYLAGNDLYVSQGGATPKELTSGLIAAAWS